MLDRQSCKEYMVRKRNDPVPKPIRAKLVNASTGAGFSSGVTCYHITSTTRSAAANSPNHDGGGTWSYTPTQAETNYEQYSIEFYHASANGYGVVIDVVNSTEPLRQEVERLFGIREWPIYGEVELFGVGSGDTSYVTWPCPVWDGSAWRVYYTTSDGSKNQIRYKKSTDGKTSWAGETDCIAAGGSGEWDEDGVWAPIVWKEGSDWYMLYTGRVDDDSVTSVGLATSSDGDTWAKSVSNPVMSPTLGWEHSSCEVTGVIKVGSTYHMFYTTLTQSGVWDVFPSYARKVGRATSTDLLTWTKAGDPIFGDADTSYQRQPYFRYSASPFKNGTNGHYYLIVAAYGAAADYSRFELWECPDIDFSPSTRRMVSIIANTHEHVFPNREIDIECIATDDIERKTWSQAGEIRMYFGTKQGGTWGIALATQSDINEALRWTPSIPDAVIDVLPHTRWNRSLGELMLGVVAESYSTAGEDCTGAELLYEIKQNITEFDISSVTKTVKQQDGVTAAATYTIDNATSPTAIERTT